MLIASGCKEKTEETVRVEQTKEVGNKEKIKALVSKEQTGQLVIDMEEISSFI
jgi:hypothetical protein